MKKAISVLVSASMLFGCAGLIPNEYNEKQLIRANADNDELGAKTISLFDEIDVSSIAAHIKGIKSLGISGSETTSDKTVRFKFIPQHNTVDKNNLAAFDLYMDYDNVNHVDAFQFGIKPQGGDETTVKFEF